MSELVSWPAGTDRDPQSRSLLHEPSHPWHDPDTAYEPGSEAPGSAWGSPDPPPVWGATCTPPAWDATPPTQAWGATPATQAWSAAPTPSALAPVVYQGPLSVTERNWASVAHLAGFAGAMIAMPFLGPLVVLLSGGNRSEYVRRHAVEALNFNLSALLWLVISCVLVLLLIGIPMVVGLVILYIVSSVRGALAAGRGEEYRYPITLRFVS